jgi:hypothetical protein
MSSFHDKKTDTLYSYCSLFFVGMLSTYNHLKGDFLAEFIRVFRVIQLTTILCILCIHCNKIRQRL